MGLHRLGQDWSDLAAAAAAAAALVSLWVVAMLSSEWLYGLTTLLLNPFLNWLSITLDHWYSPLFFFLFFFFKFIYFNWRLITLQYCSGFCHTLTWISHGCTCVPHSEPSSHSIPLGHPSAPALSTLSHALNLDWWPVSHMLIYMFQCYSLRSPHPRLLPQSPKDCSIHLCLFCCLAYRVIITNLIQSSVTADLCDHGNSNLSYQH